MGKSQKNYMSIKSKLMAAVAMLLVASFMVVSSTYAWFTLSTAPEVTGITTSVGANGNLEIALLYNADSLTMENSQSVLTNSLTTAAGDIATTTGGLTELKDKNVTWGNLVAMKQGNTDIYGLNGISLKPTRLNVTGASETGYTLAAAPLLTPEYDADGRVKGLNANTESGVFNEQGQYTNKGIGVRAIGSISNKSQQEIDFMNAMQAFNNAISNARNLATKSINANGQGLTELLMNYSTASASTELDVTALENMIGTLNGPSNNGVVYYLTEAKKAIVKAAYATASSATAADAYLTVTDVTFDGETITLKSGNTEVTVPADMVNQITNYTAFNGYLTSITTQLADATGLLPNDDTHKLAYDTVTEVLKALMNPTRIKVQDKTITELKEGIATEGGITGYIPKLMGDTGKIDVEMFANSGVYSDIAQATGDAQNGEITGSSTFIVPVSIRTNVTEKFTEDDSTTLGFHKPTVPPPQVDAANKSTNFTDLYGYALDLAFRTNAANSNLLLQSDPQNRIYSENGSVETMGNGATMTFSSTDPAFTAAHITGLMEHIYVVFADVNGKIVAVAKADTATTVEGDDGITAYLYLHEFSFAAETDGKCGRIIVGQKKGLEEDGTGTYNPAIMSIDQNTTTVLSAYVYMDGDTVDNGDVGTGDMSMTGTLNLQFSSDATLKPMQYSDLMNGSTKTEQNTNQGDAGQNP